MDIEDRIKLFAMSQASVERQLDQVEATHHLDLGRGVEDADRDEEYYPQFDHSLRVEAAAMGRHYELFYCLEQSIRQLIEQSLVAEHGHDWWKTQVPEAVRKNAETNMQRETDDGVSSRSDAEIDFTTFGELGEIVRSNWTSFDAIFSSQKAFTKIMRSLNMLRGPIAHCCPIAADEVVRLRLTVRDWFRLME